MPFLMVSLSLQPALERSAPGAAVCPARGPGALPPHSHILRAARGLQRVTLRVERRASKDSEETESLQLECDLLVAADGSMSATRRRIRPDESRRCVSLSRPCSC